MATREADRKASCTGTRRRLMRGIARVVCMLLLTVSWLSGAAGPIAARVWDGAQASTQWYRGAKGKIDTRFTYVPNTAGAFQAAWVMIDRPTKYAQAGYVQRGTGATTVKNVFVQYDYQAPIYFPAPPQNEFRWYGVWINNYSTGQLQFMYNGSVIKTVNRAGWVNQNGDRWCGMGETVGDSKMVGNPIDRAEFISLYRMQTTGAWQEMTFPSLNSLDKSPNDGSKYYSDMQDAWIVNYKTYEIWTSAC